MELGSWELHIFVSLAVVLGTAFIALIVDYLKGSNEQLREDNIELRVRSEESERRTILDPASRLAGLIPAALLNHRPAESGEEESKSQSLVAKSRAKAAKNGRNAQAIPHEQFDAGSRLDLGLSVVQREAHARAAMDAIAPIHLTPETSGAHLLDRVIAATPNRTPVPPSAPAVAELTPEPEFVFEHVVPSPAPAQASAEARLNLTPAGLGSGNGDAPKLTEPAVEAPGAAFAEPAAAAANAEAAPTHPETERVVLVKPVEVAETEDVLSRPLLHEKQEVAVIQPAQPELVAAEQPAESASEPQPAAPVPVAAEIPAPQETSSWADLLQEPLDDTSQAAVETPRQDANPFQYDVVFSQAEEPAKQTPAAPRKSEEIRVPPVSSRFETCLRPEAAIRPRPVSQPEPLVHSEPAMLPKSVLRPQQLDTSVAPPAPPVAQKLVVPAGLHGLDVLNELLGSDVLFSGLAISIGINDFGKIQESSARTSLESLMQSVTNLARACAGERGFVCRTREDEYLLILADEQGTAAQRRLNQVSERLWDFQLRSLGSLSILFSWGSAEVQHERLSEAIAAANERMYQTKRSRKTITTMDSSRMQKRAVNA